MFIKAYALSTIQKLHILGKDRISIEEFVTLCSLLIDTFSSPKDELSYNDKREVCKITEAQLHVSFTETPFVYWAKKKMAAELKQTLKQKQGIQLYSQHFLHVFSQKVTN